MRLERYFDLLNRKKRAYQRVFDRKKEDVQIVLSDLRSLCPSDPTKGMGKNLDDRKVYLNIGRKQILSHIINMLDLSDEDIVLMAKSIKRENLNARTDESYESD